MMSISSPPSFDETPPSFDEPPSFDVGVAVRIAKKKKRDQQLQQERESRRNAPSPSSTCRPHSSLKDFLYGISLYVLCLSLPTLLGALTARLYQEQQSLHVESYYEQMSDYLCQNWWTFWCPTDDSSLPSLQAPDAEWTDVGIVAILSLSLTILRLALVHLLVPRYLAPKRLEALVRCKSVHLLSSAYPKSLTPQSTPPSSRRNVVQVELPLAPILFPLENSVEKESEWTSQVKDVWHKLQRYCGSRHSCASTALRVRFIPFLTHLLLSFTAFGRHGVGRHVGSWGLSPRLLTTGMNCKISIDFLLLPDMPQPSFVFCTV